MNRDGDEAEETARAERAGRDRELADYGSSVLDESAKREHVRRLTEWMLPDWAVHTLNDQREYRRFDG